MRWQQGYGAWWWRPFPFWCSDLDFTTRYMFLIVYPFVSLWNLLTKFLSRYFFASKLHIERPRIILSVWIKREVSFTGYPVESVPRRLDDFAWTFQIEQPRITMYWIKTVSPDGAPLFQLVVTRVYSCIAPTPPPTHPAPGQARTTTTVISNIF